MYYTKHNLKLLLTVCLKIEPNNTSKFITLISTYFCNHIYFELYSTAMHCLFYNLLSVRLWKLQWIKFRKNFGPNFIKKTPHDFVNRLKGLSKSIFNVKNDLNLPKN